MIINPSPSGSVTPSHCGTHAHTRAHTELNRKWNRRPIRHAWLEATAQCVRAIEWEISETVCVCEQEGYSLLSCVKLAVTWTRNNPLDFLWSILKSTFKVRERHLLTLLLKKFFVETGNQVKVTGGSFDHKKTFWITAYLFSDLLLMTLTCFTYFSQ